MKRNILLVAVSLFAVFFSFNSAFAYTVKRGDNLWKLAEKHYGKRVVSKELCRKIAKVNGMKNLHRIYPGQNIEFPELESKKVAGKKLAKVQSNLPRDEKEDVELIPGVAMSQAEKEEAKKPVVDQQSSKDVVEKFKQQVLAQSQDVEKDKLVDDSMTEQAVIATMDRLRELLNRERESGFSDSEINKSLLELLEKAGEDVESKKAKRKDDSVVSFESRIGYEWSCYDQFGQCQRGYFLADVNFPVSSSHRLGLEVGFDWTLIRLTDLDSHLEGDEKAVHAGLVYRYAPNKKFRLLVGNGIELKKVEDEISGGGRTFQRNQEDAIFYTNWDLQKDFERWRIGTGIKFEYPLISNLNSDLPGDSELNHTFFHADLRLLRKVINDETYVGINVAPLIFSSRTRLIGAEVSTLFDYKVNSWMDLSTKIGVIFYPYGFPRSIAEQGATISSTWSPVIGLGLKFKF